MTTQELLALIRAEIERRITDNTFGAKLELIDILAWLETLEEPEVVNDLTDDSTKAVRLPDGRYVTEKLAKEIGEPVCEELDEEINRYYSDNFYELPPFSTIEATARHFANWQKAQVQETIELAEEHALLAGRMQMKEEMDKKQSDSIAAAYQLGLADKEKEFEKNRLAACDAMTKEECKREMDFADEIINKEHRQPTFSDAINYGMKLQKEQIMKSPLVSVGYTASEELQRINYENGRRDMKQEMMKDAVETELYWDGDFLAIDLNMRELGYSEHDKVKLIICKED